MDSNPSNNLNFVSESEMDSKSISSSVPQPASTGNVAVSSASSSGTASVTVPISSEQQMVYILEGQTLILSDSEGRARENINLSGFAPDILQQALQEVTSGPTGDPASLNLSEHSSSTSSLTTSTSLVENDSTLISHESPLDQLANVAVSTDTQTANTAVKTEFQQSIQAEVTKQPIIPTSTIKLENANVTLPTKPVSVGNIITTSHLNATTPKSAIANDNTITLQGTGNGKNMVLIPSTDPNGTITYYLKQQPITVNVPQQPITVNVPQQPIPSTHTIVNIPTPVPTAPTIVPTIQNFATKQIQYVTKVPILPNQSLLKPMGSLQPVNAHQLGINMRPISSVLKPQKHHPVILPKPVDHPIYTLPKTSGPIVTFQKSGPKVSRVSQSNTKAAKSSNKKPLGSTENPIELIQQGSTFHSSQPLNNSQVTQIANIIKQTKKDINNKDCEIVYDRGVNSKGQNTRIVYKVVYPEDLNLTDPKSLQKPAVNPPKDNLEDESNIRLKDTVKAIDSSDSDTYSDLEDNENMIPRSHGKLFPPHGFVNIKKRGRPLKGMPIPYDSEKHIKKLSKEFGLPTNVAQQVETHITDDRKRLHEDELDDDSDTESTKNNKVAITRSGRISRPPPPKDEVLNKKSDAVSSTNFKPPVVKKAKEKLEPDKPVVPASKVVKPIRGKRNFNVPGQYRCKVCSKIYLGQRKMLRHVKYNPGHGPSEEPLQVPKKPKAPTKATQKLTSNLPIPIIPLARTQLEDLVKNLDAELVLDVVSKKMFDNFSLWDLQLKKASLNSHKGIKKLEGIFSDMEKCIEEVKKVVDACLTSTNLSPEGAQTMSIQEGMQGALNVHEGPWYLEQINHINDEYHKLLNIENVIVSPRSDSNLMLMHPDDENSNSMLSSVSDKDNSHTGGGMGAQMVLETNLGAQSLDMDDEEDSQDCSPKKRSRLDSECDDSKLHDNSRSQSPVSMSQEEDSNMSLNSNAGAPLKHISESSNGEVDPKKVLEQHGINISNCDEEVETDVQPLNVSTSELAREIDSLNQFTPVTTSTTTESEFQRTPLPSFSSIIAGSPHPKEPSLNVATTADDMPVSSDSLLGSVSDSLLAAANSSIADVSMTSAVLSHMNHQHPSHQITHQPATPMSIQQPQTPMSIHQPQTPMTVQQPQTPLSLQQPQTPMSIQQPQTPLSIQQPQTPMTVQQPQTPLSLQQPQTPMSLQQPQTPMTIQQPQTPMSVQQPPTPMSIPQQPVTPMSIQQPQTPISMPQQQQTDMSLHQQAPVQQQQPVTPMTIHHQQQPETPMSIVPSENENVATIEAPSVHSHSQSQIPSQDLIIQTRCSVDFSTLTTTLTATSQDNNAPILSNGNNASSVLCNNISTNLQHTNEELTLSVQQQNNMNQDYSHTPTSTVNINPVTTKPSSTNHDSPYNHNLAGTGSPYPGTQNISDGNGTANVDSVLSGIDQRRHSISDPMNINLKNLQNISSNTDNTTDLFMDSKAITNEITSGPPSVNPGTSHQYVTDTDPNCISSTDQQQQQMQTNPYTSGPPSVSSIDQQHQALQVQHYTSGPPSVSSVDQQQKSLQRNHYTSGPPSVCSVDQQQQTNQRHHYTSGPPSVASVDQQQQQPHQMQHYTSGPPSVAAPDHQLSVPNSPHVTGPIICDSNKINSSIPLTSSHSGPDQFYNIVQSGPPTPSVVMQSGPPTPSVVMQSGPPTPSVIMQSGPPTPSIDHQQFEPLSGPPSVASIHQQIEALCSGPPSVASVHSAVHQNHKEPQQQNATTGNISCGQPSTPLSTHSESTSVDQHNNFTTSTPYKCTNVQSGPNPTYQQQTQPLQQKQPEQQTQTQGPQQLQHTEQHNSSAPQLQFSSQEPVLVPESALVPESTSLPATPSGAQTSISGKEVQNCVNPNNEIQSLVNPANEIQSLVNPTNEIQSCANSTNEIQSCLNSTSDIQSSINPSNEIQSCVNSTNEIQSCLNNFFDEMAKQERQPDNNLTTSTAAASSTITTPMTNPLPSLSVSTATPSSTPTATNIVSKALPESSHIDEANDNEVTDVLSFVQQEIPSDLMNSTLNNSSLNHPTSNNPPVSHSEQANLFSPSSKSEAATSVEKALTSLTEAEAQVEASTTAFINDLESVFSGTHDFTFPSALGNDHLNMKTPEKLLKSIPPSSMMVESRRSILNKTESDTAKPSASSSSTNERTDFLGALGPSTNQNRSNSFPINSYEDNQLNEDFSSQNSTAGDSLSKLFDDNVVNNTEKTPPSK